MRNDQKRNFARHLRKAMTDAERRLWYHLRNRRLQGFKFRRQVPVGRYIVDFACLEAGLVVEVDGGQHVGCANDVERDAFLRAKGFEVLRFWNNEVLAETDSVLETISMALAVPPSPQPSPASGRGRQAS